MKTNEAMKVLAVHRGDAVVVCALYSVILCMFFLLS